MRLVLFAAVVWAVACAPEPTSPPIEDSGEDVTEPVAFALTSAAFAAGETIPLAYECGPPFTSDGPGDNLTPPLAWTPGPEGTRSYVVVMRDRDFQPAGFEDGLIHWAIYDIPATANGLPEGIADGAVVADPAGAMQAEMQSSGFFGYFGPCSPNSVNTYRFTVYAMDVPTLELGGDVSEITVAERAEAGALDQASLAGES